MNRLRWILGGLGLLYGVGGAIGGMRGVSGGGLWLLIGLTALTAAAYALAWLRIDVVAAPVLLGAVAVCVTVMHVVGPYSGLGFAYVLPWLAVFTVTLRAVIVIGLIDSTGLALAGFLGLNPGIDIGATVGITFGMLFSFAFAVAVQQLSVVRERTEAAAQARASEAVLAERQRFAREIHDVLAHSLSAQLLHLEGAALLLERGGPPEQALVPVRQAIRLVREGLAETKQALHALRGEDIDVHRQIAALAGEFSAATGAVCESNLEPVPLAPDACLTLVRTAQEALTNIRRHAPGADCRIRLSREGDRCELEIRDTGRPGGRPPEPRPEQIRDGYGLVGMRERAELIGGTLSARTEGNGFRVLLRLPLVAAAEGGTR